MMTLKLQIILIVALGIALLVVLNMVRTKKLDLKYALAWILADVIVIIAVLIPGFLGWLASLLGIYNAMNMVFFLGFCFLILIVFIMTVALSRNSGRIRKLSQQLALYEKMLEEKEKKDE